MDAFYASVEQRDRPELRGLPVVVGGQPDKRGVVATASYEARKFGIRSAMSSMQAFKRCPTAHFVPPRFDVYRDISKHIRSIFSRYTDLIEPLSLDEAYLDVTEDKQHIGSALDIAKSIREAIETELQLTASAGVSVNKFVAKIASDLDKPNGLTFVGPSKVERFIEALPIEKFHGIGRVTAQRMHEMQIFYGSDLKKKTLNELLHVFGKIGRFYYEIARGIDNRPVTPFREVKSIGAEDTFEQDLFEWEDLDRELRRLCERVAGRLQKKDLEGKTLTVKIKFPDFTISNRQVSFPHPIPSKAELFYDIAGKLLRELIASPTAIRLMGVTISNFNSSESSGSMTGNQLRLF